MSTSIILHTVTIQHSSSLDTRMVAKALDDAGYDVDSISPETEPATQASYLSRCAQWARREEALSSQTRESRHRDHCGLCRTTMHALGREKIDLTSVVVGNVSPTPTTRCKASVSISGMTCGSCAGKISAALERLPFVTAVNVGLITQTAFVEFSGDESLASALIDTINELGYEATMDQVSTLPANPISDQQALADLWQASYSIEGMTCSSCVRTLTEALRSFTWVREADVNLITNSATVTFEDKSHLELLATAIEDAGYGADLNEVKSVFGEAVVRDERRVVSIAIDGMYCEHCPDKVAEALQQLNGLVTLEKAGTTKDPIFVISYTPHAPDFTIRAICSAIAAADSDLEPRVHHPPTVEERARQMHGRVQRRILRRVLLSIVVAVPTFIIGIVYMTLVPTSNPGRRYLEEPVGGVSRAEWALLTLATPVFLFAAEVFHRRAAREVYSLWKPGSPTPILRRLYRFGSMDMLISLGTTIAYVSSLAEVIAAAASLHKTGLAANTTYFDSVVFLTMFLLIGRLIEAYSKAKTGDAVSTLQNLRPAEALLCVSGSKELPESRTEIFGIDMIDLGDTVKVVQGNSPHWDGVVISGDTVFDESSLTGESKPVKKSTGEPVYAGTINKGQPVLIQITRISGDSMLDQIIKVVREGQARRAPV